MVLSWWSQDLVRRPNNQNGQIQKLIFDPYFPLSSPFEKFWSIVPCDLEIFLHISIFCNLADNQTSLHHHGSIISNIMNDECTVYLKRCLIGKYLHNKPAVA